MRARLNVLYRNAAEEFARRVTHALGSQIDCIVLYGSVVRGRAKRDSDIDILVISRESKLTGPRVNDICSEFTHERGYSFFISVVHFGREEFQQLVRLGSPFIHEVMDEGVVLHDNGTFSGQFSPTDLAWQKPTGRSRRHVKAVSKAVVLEETLRVPFLTDDVAQHNDKGLWRGDKFLKRGAVWQRL